MSTILLIDTIVAGYELEFKMGCCALTVESRFVGFDEKKCCRNRRPYRNGELAQMRAAAHSTSAVRRGPEVGR